jgi:hypothetical protein
MDCAFLGLSAVIGFLFVALRAGRGLGVDIAKAVLAAGDSVVVTGRDAAKVAGSAAPLNPEEGSPGLEKPAPAFIRTSLPPDITPSVGKETH